MWNYRIIFHDKDPNDIHYGLHEVYYDEDIPYGHTEHPIIVSDTAKGIQEILVMMLQDTFSHQILTYNDLPYKDKL